MAINLFECICLIKSLVSLIYSCNLINSTLLFDGDLMGSYGGFPLVAAKAQRGQTFMATLQ